MNWRRTASFSGGLIVWALLDIVGGNPANPELWMLAGLATSWLTEPQKD